MKTLSKILIALCLLANAQALIAQEANTEDSMLSDPMYRFQWHLSGEGFAWPGENQSGQNQPFGINPSTQTVHLNVAEVWKKYKGDGIYIAIVESMNVNHEDLKANIAREYSHVYGTPRTNSFLVSHGTAVAGVAAARGYNGIGVRGVAPFAKIFNLSGDGFTTADSADSFTRHSTITAVSNHSYVRGPFKYISPMIYMAMETGIDEGFHGKGTVYVLGAGNSGDSGDNSNYDMYKNYHAGVTVCGVDYQGKYNNKSSEPGANLWICALVAEKELPGKHSKYSIVTTDLVESYQHYKGYKIRASGTSNATPMIAGIVALMRQANRNLSWRDVKVILADSAVKTDPDDKGWGQSGMKYGSFDERYHFNHQYGFGLVDAKAAVDLAEEWVNLPPREEDAVVKEEINSTARTISKSLIMESDIDFIEHVDATIDFSINKIRDLSIELISPSGTKSILAASGYDSERGYNHQLFGNRDPQPWRFGSSRHLGEPASGEWRLIARNARAGNTITLRSWELRIRGYQVKLEAVAAENLSDLNQAEPPLTLSLHGALWKETLEPSDFILRKAPSNLSIASVTTTTEVQQIQLKLELADGKLDGDYDFQVVATTGTVSNHSTPLISNDIEIARIAHNKEAVIPQGTVGFNYVFTAEDILISPTTLRYVIKVVQIVNGKETEMDLETLGFTQKGPIISGTPQVLGTHRFKITARRQNDETISRTEYITLNVQPPYTVRTQIKVYPEGLLE